jgi:L-rhamnono-1,4-lactonase
MEIPIVDSHVHLFPQTHAPTLAWQTPDGPLFAQYSVDEYRAAVESDVVSTAVPRQSQEKKNTPFLLRGFVFLEADRISSLDEDAGGWNHALDEVSLIARIASGTPVAGEGHLPTDGALCLGIVPWAPVPGGPPALEKYVAAVRQRVASDAVFHRICGIRYLVQDKPAGTMLRDDFIAGLKWLGKRHWTFDIGLDARQDGVSRLQEALAMIQKAHDGVEDQDRVVFILGEFMLIVMFVTAWEVEFLNSLDLSNLSGNLTDNCL